MKIQEFPFIRRAKRRRNSRAVSEKFISRKISKKKKTKIIKASETAANSNFLPETTKEKRKSREMASGASSKDCGGEKRLKGGDQKGKMVSGKELEEFFAAGEKKEKERFLKKYNYDLERDRPVEGRYDWVRIDP